MTTGNKIRQLRLQKGMSLEDLAKLIGTTRQTMSKYERDLIDMSNNKLVQIANALRVSPASLIDWSEDNPLGNDIQDLPNLGDDTKKEEAYRLLIVYSQPLADPFCV